MQEVGTKLDLRKDQMKIKLSTISLLLIGNAFAMRAATITQYDLNFTPTTGALPAPTGSFYSDGTTITDLTIRWNGLTFGIPVSPTPSVTRATGCSGESATAAYGVMILTQIVSGCNHNPPIFNWDADTTSAPGEFGLGVATAPLTASGFFGDIIDFYPPTGGIGTVPSGLIGGTWTVTAASTAVPEPSSVNELLFVASTLFLLGLAGRIRRSYRIGLT